LRVKGDEEMEEDEEEREGENAVRRRRREVPVDVRRGVKDWKRFVRVVACIFAVGGGGVLVEVLLFRFPFGR
jgi:hypothetical protein